MKKSISILLAAFIISFSIVAFQQVRLTSADNYKVENSPVIIIDAGHGGEDGGAVGIDGTAEKDLNLSISLKLNEILSAMGYQTRMVRTTDTSIHNSDANTVRERKVSDIHNRAAIMNEYENCIYVSIHQNKYSGSSIWGAQTFYSPNNEESKELAQLIQASIANNIQPDNKRVIKQSGTNIYVLYNATKPAVMVECGFVSNANELEQLKNEEYQNEMAFAISNGIINYLFSEGINGTEV
ncbi:MAG: N-acetylmuramoyl-L-alanine amidase [Candidatus Fimenecus sp.]